MADQSRQIKLAAAKKKVKYFTYSTQLHIAESVVPTLCTQVCVNSVFLSFRYVYFLRGKGVVITRRPSTALSLVRPPPLLSRLCCVGETDVLSGPLVIALTFPDYVDYF